MNENLKTLLAYENSMFADREDMRAAFDYALRVAQASENPPAVITAVYVVLNTALRIVRENVESEGEL